ncbi:MAG: 2,3-bisphosphoglycerate-independent phosphoglycerate mutase [Patescibacteria group bacterium]
MPRPSPALLVILDGFGLSTEKDGNPVAVAKMPTLDAIERFSPFLSLQASGTAIGLPWGVPGNSETGHLIIGSGRIIYHHLPRIINAIHDGTFAKIPALAGAIEHARKNKSTLHLLGLVSTGTVHSYIDHLYALWDVTRDAGIAPVYLHVFTDGKDAPPKEGASLAAFLAKEIHANYRHVALASVIGRFYAMDRDLKWDRTELAVRLLLEGEGASISSLSDYLLASYMQNVTDEFIAPARIASDTLPSGPLIRDGDALFFFNFREDSMRQIVHALTDDEFPHFHRRTVQNLYIATMTEYERGLAVHAAFPTLETPWPLAAVLGEQGIRHLHIAETQKYAHVTYFFNGGVEDPLRGETRMLIPSLDVKTFDERPEMRAPDIARYIIDHFADNDVVIANFANADMVGHTGNFDAATRTVEELDKALGLLVERILETPAGVMLVTADHGNIETKRDRMTGEKITKHSLAPVPLYLVRSSSRRAAPRTDVDIARIKKEPAGVITDVAPTFLELLEMTQPPEMTGKSLLPELLASLE